MYEIESNRKNGLGMPYGLVVKCLSSGINLDLKKGTKKGTTFSLGNET